MKRGAIKIRYINACGKIEYGYTTRDELYEQGNRAYVWITDDIADIKDCNIMSGWTIDYLDIVKIYDRKER